MLLDALVPEIVRRRVARSPAPLSGPVAERFTAAVLVADLSGFSALAERLARRGARGAENLKELLDILFGRLVDLVDSHGGEVLKFPGDATIALWPAEGMGAAAAARCAARCGLDAQGLVKGIETAEASRLRLRVGVGVGEVWTAYVGGVEGRWELVVAGEPLDGAVAAAGLAQPDEVLVSRSVGELIAPSAVLRELPSGASLLESMSEPVPSSRAARIELPPGAEPLLRAYVSRAVRLRLDACQTEWLAELRRVSILFVCLGKLDHAAEGALERLQGAVVRVQTAIYRYGGSVNQLLVDDKGTVVVCGWGLASHSHGDDAVRAARAAAEIRRELGEEGLAGSFGVATGEVFTGLRGSPVRAEYAMIGSVVNLAARLMQAARGEVLCDEATFEAARQRIDFQTLDPIHVKGREQPVAVYRPGPSRTVARPVPSEIVGRVAERRILGERIEALTAGRGGGVVILEGEAGIGKSRLVAEVVERARALGVMALVAAGDAVERSASFHAWRALFDRLLGLEGLGTGDRDRRVLKLLETDPRLSSFAAFLDPVLHLAIPETELTQSATPLGRAQLTRDLLVQLFFGATGGAPAVLVLEDAHWFDSASWALAQGLHRPLGQLLIVIAMRPLAEEGMPAELRRLSQAEGAVRLELGALAEDEARVLVCQRLRASALDEAVARVILQKAEGHPMFTEELAYALRDRELVRVDDGLCRFATTAAAFDSLSLPGSVQAVITSRIDHLTAEQQLTLKVASVLGRTFDLGSLRAVHPIGASLDELPGHLEALEARDLARLVSTRPAPTYEFRHSITQSVAYGLLPFSRRRQLHQAVAQWYERQHGDDLAPVYALLAHHWSKAEVGEKSVFYLDKAGEQAFDRYANEEAVRFITEALETDRRLGDRLPAGELRHVRWERQLGEAYVNLGMWQEGWDHLEGALALLGLQLPSSPGGWKAGLLKQVLAQALLRLRPWPARKRGQEAALLLREGVCAYSRLGRVSYTTQRDAEFLYTYFTAMNISERFGFIPELAVGYADAGNICGMVPLHGLARHYGRLARRAARELGDPATSSKVLTRTSIYRTTVGDWSACADLDLAMSLAEQVSDPYFWGECATLRARVAHLQGELERASRIGGEIHARAVASATAVHQVWGLAAQALALLHLGSVAKAIELAESGLRLLTSSGRRDRVALPDLLGVLAAGRLHLGELDLARQAADRLLEEHAQSARPGHFAGLGMSAAAETYVALWEAGPADGNGHADLAAKAREACRALVSCARVNQTSRARAFLWGGCLEWLEGRQDAAHASWRRCLAEAGRFALPYETARAHCEIGRHLGVADPARREHLALAGQGFERLGAQPDLERVTAALRLR